MYLLMRMTLQASSAAAAAAGGASRLGGDCSTQLQRTNVA